MGTITQDFSLLLTTAPLSTVQMAQQLLGEAGLPSLVHDPLCDSVELAGARLAAFGTNLFVANFDLERARALLTEVWGEIPSRYDPRLRT